MSPKDEDMFWNSKSTITKEESTEIKQRILDLEGEMLKLQGLFNSLRGYVNKKSMTTQVKEPEKEEIIEETKIADGFDDLRNLNKLHPPQN